MSKGGYSRLFFMNQFLRTWKTTRNEIIAATAAPVTMIRVLLSPSEVNEPEYVPDECPMSISVISVGLLSGFPEGSGSALGV